MFIYAVEFKPFVFHDFIILRVHLRGKMTKEEYYADTRRHMSAKTRRILEEEQKRWAASGARNGG